MPVCGRSGHGRSASSFSTSGNKNLQSTNAPNAPEPARRTGPSHAIKSIGYELKIARPREARTRARIGTSPNGHVQPNSAFPLIPHRAFVDRYQVIAISRQDV